MKMNNYFFISRDKEINDTEKLTDIIRSDAWIDSDTIIVTCSPDYSSGLTMIINHKLSHLNENELFPQIKMEMPYPNMTQVWNERMESQHFDTYLKEWCSKYIDKSYKYLFIDSGTLRGKNFNKVKLTIKDYLDNDRYKFASLYLQKSSIFTPHYYVESFDAEKQGGLLFWWENIDNPNWNY